jgi:hypothetical protein
MTCEESSEIKNNILNSESVTKLKKLMDKIICSSPESISNENVAKRNAVIIENIFLLLSNMLVGNEEALTPIIDSGFITHILNHLSPDTDDKKRQDAGNIINQQKSSLPLLHSITFHQTDHINTLLTSDILRCVKICMNGGNKETIELGMGGVLYNISIKGNAGSARRKEVGKNDYLKEFEEEEGLMEMINNAAKSTTTTTYNKGAKLYATLIIAQLHRNTKLKEQYKYIISILKGLVQGNDTDISFKARNSLEVLCENIGMLLFILFYFILFLIV